jgi:aminomethyltransferase
MTLARGIAMIDQNTTHDALRSTPLEALNVALGARMVAFAGYAMPVQFSDGILAEHLHTRAAAGLFDVSHMGQATIAGPAAGGLLERLVPADLERLQPGQMCYSQLLNADGGIIDDLMITKLTPKGSEERFFLVVNAARKDVDFAHMRGHLPELDLVVHSDRALIALQGPKAGEVLARHLPAVAAMPFMTMQVIEAEGVVYQVSRAGYTGEDGFEIAVGAAKAETFARRLLESPNVRPIGLGARDSLRLEAGLCLYGHDIDETTSPVEAGLAWSIGKRRRSMGGFAGESRVLREMAEGPKRRRVGLLPDGRAPAREGSEIAALDGRPIGTVTSGGFGPSLNAPVAMGYVESSHASPDTPIALLVRGRALAGRVAKLPFVPHRYFHQG